MLLIYVCGHVPIQEIEIDTQVARFQHQVRYNSV